MGSHSVSVIYEGSRTVSLQL